MFFSGFYGNELLANYKNPFCKPCNPFIDAQKQQFDPEKHIQQDNDFLRTLPEWFIFMYPLRTNKKREYEDNVMDQKVFIYINISS